MKKKILYSFTLLLSAVCLFSFDMPKGWYPSGDAAKSYDMGIDKGMGRDGKNVATIKSNTKTISGFGTLMQTAIPDKYLGKRVRMTGYLKSANVAEWSGLWFRVDQKGRQAAAFDNMQDRAIKGTTDWKRYEIVLEVAQNSSHLAYGALLVGTGQIWFDDIQFEIVDNAVPLTGGDLNALEEPRNLGFEE
jgi:hypothetical protein